MAGRGEARNGKAREVYNISERSMWSTKMRDYKYLHHDTFHMATMRPWKKIIALIAQVLLIGFMIIMLIIILSILTTRSEDAGDASGPHHVLKDKDRQTTWNKHS